MKTKPAVFLAAAVVASAAIVGFLVRPNDEQDQVQVSPDKSLAVGQAVCEPGSAVIVTFPPPTGNLVLDLGAPGHESVDSLVPDCVEPEEAPFDVLAKGIPGGTVVDVVPTDVLPTDSVPPVVTATLDRSANTSRWYSSAVTVSWESSDPEPSTGVPNQPPLTVVSAEGRDQFIESAQSCDPAGNCAIGNVTVSLDSTPPVVTVNGNSGPFALTDSLNIVCTVTDALSGVAEQVCPSVTGPASQLGVGSKTFEVKATDNAGNTTLTSFVVTVRAPAWPPVQSVAVGATLSTGPGGTTFSGSGHRVTATVRSESFVRVSGAGHSFTGGVEYVGSLMVGGAGTVINPSAVQVASGSFNGVTIADYRPGGQAGVVLGTVLRSVPLAKCVGGATGTWTPTASDLFDSSVLYVPCGVNISGAGFTKIVSVVAEGPIRVSGAGVSLSSAHLSTPVLLSGSTSIGAITVSGANVRILGGAQTPGGLVISGAGSTSCSLVGASITVSGANAKISKCP
jgi:hypothetical protein